MIWYIAGFIFLMGSFLGVHYLRAYLKTKITNSLLVWLFSISLSLSLNFLIFLLVISIVLNIQFKF